MLYKIRKKFPKLLRRITLNQFLKAKNTLYLAGDASNVVWFLSSLTPLPLIYAVVKKVIGKRAEYVFKVYLRTWIAQEIYKEVVMPKKSKKISIHDIDSKTRRYLKKNI